ncbi:MAG TPA: glycosyltransferase family 2 protein [Thermoanaerobaculia bacterium]|nr:glycosyltransferase family 2 protein [Thermoanaerobaculia bacterium]
MPAPPPELSIVIPTHDTRDLTLRCLETIFASPPSSGELEVVLVDDASRDGTAEEARVRYPGAIVLRNDTAGGFTRSANRGLGATRGKVLLLLNSDTEVEPGALDRLLGIFSEAPELGIVGAALYYPDGSPQWSGGAAPSHAWFFALSSGLPALLARLPFYRRVKPLEPAGPVRVDWVTGAALGLRRAVWETAGPLDEGFRFYAQDLDFCLRARRAGWEVAIDPSFRVMHHHGATIGREAGARRNQHPELLWTDLLRWARKHRGEGWAARAGLALRSGARLRLASRRLAFPLLSRDERELWRADDRAFRAALLAIRGNSV